MLTYPLKTAKRHLEKERITKVGLKAIVSAIPSLIDDKFKYNELSQSLVNEISTQIRNIPERPVEPKQIYNDDVKIIIRDGKYYYLNESS